MQSVLKNKKLSQTPFREEVLAIFNLHNSAIPLSTIESELKKYDRVTLYRTMKVFLEKGIIHEITISGEESNFAICKEACESDQHHHQHIHFKCSNCHSIFCVEIDQFPSISIPGYQIDQLEIQASGLCRQCSNN